MESKVRALKTALEVLSATSSHLQGYPEYAAPGAGPRASRGTTACPELFHSPSLAGSQQRQRWESAGLCMHILILPSLVSNSSG